MWVQWLGRNRAFLLSHKNVQIEEVAMRLRACADGDKTLEKPAGAKASWLVELRSMVMNDCDIFHAVYTIELPLTGST